MVVIDGVRVRAEDEARYRARGRAGAGPLTVTLADPSNVPPPAEMFDPAGVTAEQVLAHLAAAGEAEAVRVLDAEAAGKNRTSVVGKREQLLAAARGRDAGDGGGGGPSS